MKRLPVHAAFGLVAGVFAIASIQLAVRLDLAERSNALIEAAALSGGLREEGSGIETAEAALARALALAHGEDYERALRALQPLTLSERAGIRQIARYDLGNLYMRQAAKIADFEVAKSRTLVELAKQWYRRTLDEDPQQWPARYNLERALWLEPEADDAAVETTPPPAVERPNGDKPELP